MKEYRDGSEEEYWGEKEIAELRELNVAAFREIAYLKNQKESLRELNPELLAALKKLYKEVDALVFTNDQLEIARLEARTAIAKAEELK